MGIPGNTKGRESTQQRTRINAHANMEIHHNSTHESIDRRNTAEKHKHRHNMEANNGRLIAQEYMQYNARQKERE